MAERMTEKRKGEIALALLKRQSVRDGLPLGEGVRRELGNASKDTGIAMEELLQFSREVGEELIEETYRPSRVKATPVE